MDNGHLRQGIGNDQGNEGTEKIRNNHAGPGEFDGHTAAKKKSDADCAANRDHGELPLAQSPLQSILFASDAGGITLDGNVLLAVRHDSGTFLVPEDSANSRDLVPREKISHWQRHEARSRNRSISSKEL